MVCVSNSGRPTINASLPTPHIPDRIGATVSLESKRLSCRSQIDVSSDKDCIVSRELGVSRRIVLLKREKLSSDYTDIFDRRVSVYTWNSRFQVKVFEL